jgi:prepilin-type processing-associated H-X9-DG protein
LVVIAIIGILVALLLPAIQAAREAARRAQCQSNLRNVALAVLNYESQNKTLPIGSVFPTPVGQIQTNFNFRQNWVIESLPYMENQPLYDSFNFEQPIRHDVNRDERGTELAVMLCPSDPYNRVFYQGAPATTQGDNWARGNYAANVGNGAIHTDPIHRIVGKVSPGWNGVDPTTRATTNNLFHRHRGVIGPNVSSKLSQITDGTSKTIMLGEIRAGVHDGDPRGLWAFGHAGGNLLAWFGFGGDSNGPNYCGVDSDDVGSDRLDCNDPQLAAECMTCHQGSGFDQATSRSAHVGGVHVAMCDGSVQFISDDIETSGSYGTCCGPWDYLIASQDANDPGTPARPPR